MQWTHIGLSVDLLPDEPKQGSADKKVSGKYKKHIKQSSIAEKCSLCLLVSQLKKLQFSKEKSEDSIPKSRPQGIHKQIINVSCPPIE